MAKGIIKNPFYIDTTSASELFETTPKTIIEWEKAAGREKRSFKISHGTYDIRKLLAWWLENIHESKQETTTTKDSRERYWHAKADKEELLTKQLKGELVPRSQLVSDRVERCLSLNKSLLALSVRLETCLEMKSKKEIRAKIDEEVRRMQTAFSAPSELWPEKSPEAGQTEEKKPAAKKAPKKAGKKR